MARIVRINGNKSAVLELTKQEIGVLKVLVNSNLSDGEIVLNLERYFRTLDEALEFDMFKADVPDVHKTF